MTAPLGMAGSALPPNDDTALPDPAAHGYLNSSCIADVLVDGGTVEPGQDTTDWNASYGQGGGGMTSTITDLGRWGAAELGSALLADATAAERAKTAEVQPGLTYGLGLMDYGDGFLGHSGEAIGWQAQVVHDGATGMTIAMATNACAGADIYLFDAIRSLVPFALDPPPTAPPTTSQ
jgi:D-alanyl-D-alanine carboxypeptidase